MERLREMAGWRVAADSSMGVELIRSESLGQVISAF